MRFSYDGYLSLARLLAKQAPCYVVLIELFLIFLTPLIGRFWPITAFGLRQLWVENECQWAAARLMLVLGGWVLMKRTILGMTQAGEPLILEALEALRLYREAKASGRPQEEIDRLQILAESLVQAVTDYQLLAVGADSIKLH